MKWLNKKYAQFKKYCAHKKTVLLLTSSGILNRNVVDSLQGPIRVEVEKNTKWIKFRRAYVGVDLNEDLTRISLWVHEFTEQIIGILILRALANDKFTLQEIAKSLDVITIQGTNKCFYAPTIKHILTSLHTISHIDNVAVDGEQYAEFHGITKAHKKGCTLMCQLEKSIYKEFYENYSYKCKDFTLDWADLDNKAP